MKTINTNQRISLLFGALLLPLFLAAQPEGRYIQNFSSGWKFFKGDVVNGQQPGFNDSSWRLLDLPHDWSIEGPFSREYASCTGYLPGGIGWYRKSFNVPDYEQGRKMFIFFDGVYKNSDVWINGKHLGNRPNGYISFFYDLTPYIISGDENIIAVRVDHSDFADSRWYTGSGIYRDVELISTEPVHIDQWGVSCRTLELTKEKAVLSATVKVVNETGRTAKTLIKGSLFLRGKKVGDASADISFKTNKTQEASLVFVVENPELWDVGNPVLYSLVTEVRGRELLDNVITKVGFRETRFDPDKGFFLNGKNMKLKGICMHHDAGTFGSAVPVQELARRLDILKEMGCNAIRTSHNPFSSAFLGLCDEKGFLVIEEAFDEWEFPKKKWIEGWNKGVPGKEGYARDFNLWGRIDLRDLILRDRNHPSIIMWSIGNEIDYPNDPYTHPVLNTEANPQTWAKFDTNLPDGNRLGEIARGLVTIIREYDNSRPVTAGLASALMSNETGYAAALDVAGYNYQEFRYETDHRKFPGRPLYGSENGMSLEAWNSVVDNDYVMGQFLWTGIEYLGEAGQFPSRHSTSGVIDIAGNRKPEFFFRQSLWSNNPMVFIGATDRIDKQTNQNLWAHKRIDPHWNWENGKTISVNAFSNCEEVELFLNGKSLGTKKMADFRNRTINWDVPFEPGALKAVARINGENAATYELKTSGTPARLTAVCDKNEIRQGSDDIAHIFVTVTDSSGIAIFNALNEITCEVSGPGRVLGLEDANPINTEDYRDNKQHSFHGKLLVYFGAGTKQGKAIVKLTSPGLQEAVVEIEIKQ